MTTNYHETESGIILPESKPKNTLNYTTRIFTCGHLDEVIAFLKLLEREEGRLVGIVSGGQGPLLHLFTIVYRNDEELEVEVKC